MKNFELLVHPLLYQAVQTRLWLLLIAATVILALTAYWVIKELRRK